MRSAGFDGIFGRLRLRKRGELLFCLRSALAFLLFDWGSLRSGWLSLEFGVAIHGFFRASLLCEVLLKSAKVPKTLLATFWPFGCRRHFFAMHNSWSGKQHILVLPCPCCDVLSHQPRIAHSEKAKKRYSGLGLWPLFIRGWFANMANLLATRITQQSGY